MKTVKFTITALIFCSALFMNVGKASAQTKEDEKAVKETVLNYIEGWYTADSVRMNKALADGLIKRGFMVHPKTKELKIAEATKAQMVEWTSKKPNELANDPSIKLKVEVIEVGKNVAMVKSIAPHFIDYIHLGKKDGEWKIYNVIWEPNFEALEKMKK